MNLLDIQVAEENLKYMYKKRIYIKNITKESNGVYECRAYISDFNYEKVVHNVSVLEKHISLKQDKQVKSFDSIMIVLLLLLVICIVVGIGFLFFIKRDQTVSNKD